MHQLTLSKTDLQRWTSSGFGIYQVLME